MTKREALLKEWRDLSTPLERAKEIQKELEDLMFREGKAPHQSDCQCLDCTYQET